MTHAIPIAILVVYLVSLFVVTWWAQRLTSRGGGGAVGYLLAGRQLPFWICAAMLTGLAVGGASTIGVAEHAYKVGISAGWYNAAWAAGALIMALVAVKRYRRWEATTLPELFERCYSPSARILAVVGQLVIQLVITSLQYVAGGAILSSLMPNVFSLRSGMIATAIVFVGITLVGGFWAAGLTNVINVVVIYAGICLGAFLTVDRIGGFDALSDRIPEGHPGMDLWAVGPALIAGWFVVMITTAISTQSVVQVGFAAKDERAAQRGFLLGALLILPVGFISAILGMTATILHPGIEGAEALPKVLLGLPPIAAGLVLAGLWAADVSTASALLIGSSALVTNDVVKRFVSPDLTPRGERFVTRGTVLGLSIITFVMALLVSGILKMLLIGLTLTTAYTLVVLMTMYWPSMCRRSSATWTLLATMASLALWLLVPSGPWTRLPHPIYFTWLTSLVTFFVVAAVDRRTIVLKPASRELAPG